MPFDTAFDTAMPTSHLHEPFLRRAAEMESSNVSGTSLGGFLTMRLVDAFAGDLLHRAPEGLAYQLRATNDYLDDLYPPEPEVQHLREIGRVARTAFDQQAPWMLLPPLLAFAYWLEQELRLDEALDAIESGLRVVGHSDRSEAVAAYLQTGRLLRLKGRFDEARQAYALAGEIAGRLNDPHSQLLSRIGRAIVLQKVGDLPQSERELRAVMEEARRTEDGDAEARACHDLSVTLGYMSRLAEAVPLTFRAFQLYEQPQQRARAMSDTGTHLKALGHYSAARDAFTIVLGSNPPLDVRFRALVELLELSAILQDQLSFERTRRELDQNVTRLPTDERAEFRCKLGLSLALFDRFSEAEACLLEAISLAEKYRMGELLFRAEGALEEIRGNRTARKTDAAPTAAVSPSHELAETIESLRLLRATA